MIVQFEYRSPHKCPKVTKTNILWSCNFENIIRETLGDIVQFEMAKELVGYVEYVVYRHHPCYARYNKGKGSLTHNYMEFMGEIQNH